MYVPLPLDEALGFATVQAGAFQDALPTGVVKTAVTAYVRRAKAAGLNAAALTELGSELVGPTTFSVASALIPMFELYQHVQVDFSTRTWVPVTEGSMEAQLEAVVQKARDGVNSAASVEPEAGPKAERRAQTGALESQWAALSRQNSKALRKRPDAPVWTHGS